MKKNQVEVKNETQLPTEIIAESIVKISDSVSKIRVGKLNEKALILLIHHDCKVSMTDIKAVLNSMESLRFTYLKPETKRKGK